jgi:phage shock protein PspC (stress-responsive transcriptional regulator)
MSFAMVPAFELLRGVGAVDRTDVDEGVWNDRWSLHVLRLSVAGVAFLVSVLLVGRLAEGLRPGTGAPAAAAFGLGTMALPLAATTFGHLPAAVLAFGAFLLASRRRPLVAGLVAGVAVLFEYQCALVALAVLGYLLARVWGPNVDFSTIWWWLGLPRPVGLLLVLVPAAAAAVVALLPLVRQVGRVGYARSRTATT